MWKQNKWKILVSCLVILVPVAAGLILWGRLPDPMPIHWNAAGEMDGWGSKVFAVLGIPALLLALHLFCVAVTCADPKHRNIPGTIFNIVVWIVPAVSVVVCGATYLAALGVEFNMSMLVFPLVGVLFIVLGNYLPKSRPNYAFGIKTPWTLDDPDVWERTHRLGGRLMVAVGLGYLLLGFFPGLLWVGIVLLAGLVVVLYLYSYLLYHKKAKSA